MKILYVSKGDHIDYQDDCLFIGLKEHLGTDVVDANKRHHCYKSFPNEKLSLLYGRGFTVTQVLDEDETDRSDIIAKIKNNYFDYIVYGSVNRCLDYFDLVSSIYPKNKIILVDGEDEITYHKLYFQKYPYFKREKINNDRSFPISFAIPTCKIQPLAIKNKEIAHLFPGDKSTYIFSNEKDYYKDYSLSRFALTTKRAGWDCMRHYEILANNCVPLFFNIESCPYYTLTMLPKIKMYHIIKDCLTVDGGSMLLDTSKVKDLDYEIIQEFFYKITQNYLTTHALGTRFLSYITHEN